MAKPTTGTFGQFLVKIGDGADPEVFGAPCGLTTKNFNQTANTQETTVPDCDDPDAPAYIERAVDTLSAEISGSGVLAKEAHEDVWQPTFQAAASVNCRVYPFGAAGGFYAGKFVLTQYNNAVQRGQKVNVDITLASDGEYTWTAGS
jgi:predicted secreted protein